MIGTEQRSDSESPYIEGILPKGPYLPCISMVGRALLAGYPRYIVLFPSQSPKSISSKVLKMDTPNFICEFKVLALQMSCCTHTWISFKFPLIFNGAPRNIQGNLPGLCMPYHDIIELATRRPGPRLNKKIVFPRYGDSYVKDKTVVETVLSLTWEFLYW